jgi:tRNA(adenine34) deaminase
MRMALAQAERALEADEIPVGAVVVVAGKAAGVGQRTRKSSRCARVVFGAYDPVAWAAGSVIDFGESPAFNYHPEINGGLLGEECGVLLSGFFAERR